MTATLPIPKLVPEVQAQLCQLAFHIFTSKPGEGEIRTGSLLGQHGRNGLEINGFTEKSEPHAVGQWSIHRRLPKLPAGPGLHIAIAPITVTRASALIWSGDAPTPIAATFRSATSPIPERTLLPETVQRRQQAWGIILPATLLVLLAASHWSVSAAKEEGSIPRVTLSLKTSKGAVRLHWRESGSLPRTALQSATLTVNQESLDLFDHYQPSGELNIQPKDRELVITLRIRREGQPLRQQTITYIDPRKELN